MNKPEKLYHGSSHLIEGVLKPILKHSTLEYIHERPAVFATERIDLASLFMFPLDALASIGFEQDIAYICIWGNSEDFYSQDYGGYVYVLPSGTFEKIGKDYEWQSFEAVQPLEIKKFEKVIDGMIVNAVQVYFVDDNAIFDKIVEDKNNRAVILYELVSENQKRDTNIRKFNI